MNIGRLFFIALVLALAWHFRDSFSLNTDSPNALRGTYAMAGDTEGRALTLRFVGDKRVQISPDGKVWGETLTYNVFDDNVYVYNGRDVWELKKEGPTLRRKDLNWVFNPVGVKQPKLSDAPPSPHATP